MAPKLPRVEALHTGAVCAMDMAWDHYPGGRLHWLGALTPQLAKVKAVSPLSCVDPECPCMPMICRSGSVECHC